MTDISKRREFLKLGIGGAVLAGAAGMVALSAQKAAAQSAPGSLLGVIGPSGSGKTTTIRLMLGALKPDRGVIRVLGKGNPGGQGRQGGSSGLPGQQLRGEPVHQRSEAVS